MSTTWLVTIEDAELRGEPVVGFSVFEGAEAEAEAHGVAKCVELAEGGRGRCKPRVEPLALGSWKRVPSAWRRVDDADEEAIVRAVEAERAACAEVARTSINQYVACSRIKSRGRG